MCRDVAMHDVTDDVITRFWHISFMLKRIAAFFFMSSAKASPAAPQTIHTVLGTPIAPKVVPPYVGIRSGKWRSPLASRSLLTRR